MKKEREKYPEVPNDEIGATFVFDSGVILRHIKRDHWYRGFVFATPDWPHIDRKYWRFASLVRGAQYRALALPDEYWKELLNMHEYNCETIFETQHEYYQRIAALDGERLLL